MKRLIGISLILLGFGFSPVLMSWGQSWYAWSTQVGFNQNGLASCPAKTLRSQTVHNVVSKNRVVVQTSPDDWSDQVRMDGIETRTRYDRSFGLCVMRIMANGEITVEYWPPMHKRDPEWRTPSMSTELIAFASPEGPMCVKVRKPHTPSKRGCV